MCNPQYQLRSERQRAKQQALGGIIHHPTQVAEGDPFILATMITGIKYLHQAPLKITSL